MRPPRDADGATRAPSPRARAPELAVVRAGRLHHERAGARDPSHPRRRSPGRRSAPRRRPQRAGRPSRARWPARPCGRWRSRRPLPDATPVEAGVAARAGARAPPPSGARRGRSSTRAPARARRRAAQAPDRWRSAIAHSFRGRPARGARARRRARCVRPRRPQRRRRRSGRRPCSAPRQAHGAPR